jgi:hypothetical protein
MTLADRIVSLSARCAPDIEIGGSSNPYLRRWYLIPRNRFLNVYLHQFMRDDDDRALHDHPWWSLSWMLRGALTELTAHYAYEIRAGEWRLRSPHLAHRLIVPVPGNTWTLFITGPRTREWGFHCPQGWVHWLDFTAGPHGETVGRGCGES